MRRLTHTSRCSSAAIFLNASFTRLCCTAGTSSPHALLFTPADAQLAAEDPSKYWGDAAEAIDFASPFHTICPTVEESPKSVGQWFAGGTMNICFNAVDRHALANPDKIALFYDSPVTGVAEAISYGSLLQSVSAVAYILTEQFHVKKGNRVVIYMPNMPEAVYTMLACARVGAVHSVVFGGFAPTELAKRIVDCGASVVITSSCGIDGKKCINYKALVDRALDIASKETVVVAHCGVWARKELESVTMKAWRDWDMNDQMQRHLCKPVMPCVAVGNNDPFYILYTSGTTGTPKGIVRDTAGTAVMMTLQMRKFLGIPKDGVVFTASDIGWIVGTNFIVYGPLLYGCTSVLYEGKPVGTPDAGAFFRLVHQYRPQALFTAPTALRAIKAVDPDGLLIKKYDISSLQRVYLAGERTDPTTVHWTENLLGTPVIDNWWQTETGSPITSAPLDTDSGLVSYRAGSCGVACPGWALEVHETEAVHHGDEGSGIGGELMIKLPLPPGSLSEIWGRPNAVRDLYLRTPGYFSTFDAGEISIDGYVSVMARTDDIINVAGHRLSTGQMEGVLCEHGAVAEAAVVGKVCDLRGEKPLGLVVLKKGASVASPKVLEELVRSHVGPIAVIEVVFVEALPKTRSGKVLRRTLRSIAAQDSNLEVPPTIENPSVVPDIWEKIHKEPMPASYGLMDFALDMLPII